MSTCDPAKSIVSFPASIKVGTQVTQGMYDYIEEPLTVEFKWGTRATVPKFETGSTGVIDEVGHGGLSESTVHFNNIIYRLYSVGLYAPSHNGWLLANKAANTVDLILIFNNPNDLVKTKYDFIFLVIPIAATSSGETPDYLSGLASPGAPPPQGYSLSSCMPSINSQFAYYATCLPRSSSSSSRSSSSSSVIARLPDGSPATKNGIVFLSLEGIQVNSSTISSIRLAENLGGSFKNISEAPQADGMHITNFLRQAGSILSSTDINRYVLTTRVLFDTVRTKNMDWVKGASAVRTDSQASYKCTQFDPEKDINKADGTVTIDLKSGQILNEVLEERNLVIKSMNTLGKNPPDRLDLVPYFIGGILGLLFLFSVGIFVYKQNNAPSMNIVSPIGTPASSTGVFDFFTNNSTTILVGVISIILGAIFGVLIALNGAISNKAVTQAAVKTAVATAVANSTN